MAFKDHKHEITCPNCEQKRPVTYSQSWNIKTGRSTGRCQRCVTAINGAKSRIKKGNIPWNKGLLGYGKWPKWSAIGDQNPAWKGGITKESTKIRNSKEYAEWRKSVFERDNYICQICMIRGGNLQADHIKPFAYNPDLRMDINNGRTLCVDCHKKTDTYLSGALKYA